MVKLIYPRIRLMFLWYRNIHMYVTLPLICRRLIYQFLSFVFSPDKKIKYVRINFSPSE